MRILIITASYPAAKRDFSGTFIQDQARVLALHHEVTVAAPRLVSLKTWLGRVRSAARGSPLPRQDSPNAGPEGGAEPRVLRFEIPNLSNRLERVTQAVWRSKVLRELARAFDQSPPDLVHAHFVRPAGVAAAGLAERWRRPVILTEHSGPFSVQLRTPAIRRETTLTLRRMTRVLAVSPALRADMVRAVPDCDPLVLGNVLDDSFFCPASPPAPGTTAAPDVSAPRFTFIGGLLPVKALDVLLDATALLASRMPTPWSIDIAGEGPLRPVLETQIQLRNLGGRVRLVGALGREEVRALLRGSTALVLPSHSETFGVVLIEAMGCGVPVIATNCGGPSYVVGPRAGVLIPPGDADALCGRMQAIAQGDLRFDPGEVRAWAVRNFGKAAWLNEYDKIITPLTGLPSLYP